MVLSIFILLENIMPFSLEIDQAFIAAILTVIGYSINDSVVVFDRVREFLANKRSDEDTPSVVNRALNDTLSRTLDYRYVNHICNHYSCFCLEAKPSKALRSPC
jgi:SecD/SecF fusion protein